LVAVTETGRADIRFLLLTYNAPGAKEIWRQCPSPCVLWKRPSIATFRSMRDERIFLAADEVEHYDAARNVSVRDGMLSVLHGPAVNADAFVNGYFVIEVESFDIAIAWAARVPHARTGSVEVRPDMDIDR
jgi:hypothetical protein